jgi:hypothetical protein
MRAWPSRDRSLILGDLPVWSLGNPNLLSTGPRTDPQRAAELRYHRPATQSAKDPDALLVLGAAPRKAFTLRARIGFAPPEDFATRDGAVDPSRPEVALLFGIVDLDCDKREGPTTQKATLVRPMKAYALVLGPDALRLVLLTEAERDMWNRKGRMTAQPIAESSAKLEGRSLDLVLKVAGDAVTVEVGGRTHRFKLPQAAVGFTGLRLAGPGFVAVSKVEVVK